VHVACHHQKPGQRKSTEERLVSAKNTYLQYMRLPRLMQHDSSSDGVIDIYLNLTNMALPPD
jgi:hypothetical protein